jgi:Primase C terminal 1 (PriCT-1)
VTADCDCAKSCGVDLLLNGYSIEAPTPGYKEDADYPIECAVEIQSEVLELALTHQIKEGSGPRPTGNAEGRVPHGERTNTACSLAGTMKKRGMSTEAIRAGIKADSDSRYDPPLTDNEIEIIVKSSAKWQAGDASVALQNSYNSQNSYSKADLPKPELRSEALCGLAGEIVRAIEPYSESDRIAILANVLTGFGNVVGPTPHARVEETEHHLNVYIVQVGDTSRAAREPRGRLRARCFGMLTSSGPISASPAGFPAVKAWSTTSVIRGIRLSRSEKTGKLSATKMCSWTKAKMISVSC